MGKVKKCSKCKKFKSLSEFHKDKSRKNGSYPQCKKCCKTYREKNKKQIIEQQNMYHKNFPWIRVFNNIKQRCNNPNNPDYKDYGGRGIKCLITEEELRKLWFQDCAWRLKKPSIDREDNDGDYTYNNCRFIEHGLNCAERNIRISSKTVCQYDINGNFIKEWESARMAERSLKVYHSQIARVCKNINDTASGFIWRYKKI